MNKHPRLALSPENYKRWKTNDPATRLDLCDAARRKLDHHHQHGAKWGRLYAPDRETFLAWIALGL